MNRQVLVSIPILFTLLACGRIAPAGAGGGAALMRNVARARALDIVAEERELCESLQREAAALRVADEFRRYDAVVTDVARGTRSNTPRIVVGTRTSNAAWLLAAHTSAVIDRDSAVPSFRFGGETFADASDGFVATFEDPAAPGLPVTLVFGNSLGAVRQLCLNLAPAWEPWLRVTHGGEVAREGPLELSGQERVARATSRTRARAARATSLARSELSSPGLEVHAAGALREDQIREYVGLCLGARAQAEAWTGAAAARSPLLLRLWARAADYLEDGDANALSLHDPLLARVDALILEPCHDGGAGVASAAAWSALGPPAEPWMSEAAGLDAAALWWGRALEDWLVRVVQTGRPVHVDALVARDAKARLSAHVVTPLRAALWRFLREKHGAEYVRALWRGTREVAAEEDAAFGAWLAARVAAAGRDERTTRREAARARERDTVVFRGVGAAEAESTTNRPAGQGVDALDFKATVDAARNAGADAFLFAAHSVDRPGVPARFGDARRDLLAPREGDVRVVATLLDASARGMRTALAAHLLAGDGGTWSGTWTRGMERGWSEFFERYEHFLEHHAALAELSRASLLSIGTGLADVTGTSEVGRRPNPAEAGWKRAGWARVIARARRMYDGLLTYTAGSIQELERAPFYSDLDFVAAELSPTLELDDEGDGLDARVQVNFMNDPLLGALLAKARASGKRILITEACFSPALDGAAQRFGSAHTSVDWQAQQFLDFAERLKTWEGTPQLAGIFAWRLGVGLEPAHATVIDSPRVLDAVRVLFLALPVH